MENSELKTIKRLLLIIVIPLVLYLLQLLSFIFIPLVFSLFIALLFMPLMRWFAKRRVPRFISIMLVVLIIMVGLKLSAELIQLTSKEILSVETNFWNRAFNKINTLLIPVEQFFGIDTSSQEQGILGVLQVKEFQKAILDRFGSTFKLVRSTSSMILMTIFFLLLLLAGSLNIEKIMQSTIFKKRIQSIKTFREIEMSIIKFIKVKTLISLLTGLGFGIVCLLFDIKFPLFWGLLAFAINYVQILGSLISTILLSIFAFIEIEPSGTLLFFIFTITAIQILLGSVLDPIFMGQSFSINTITILVMLMLWGFIWGIPGLILSIPITVTLKTVFAQFPNTRVIAKIMT